MTSKSDLNRMTTRSIAKLSPLETKMSQMETKINASIGNATKTEIPKLEEELKNGEISVAYFKVEMYKINDKVKDLYNSMNDMKELIKKEAKKSEDRAIQHSIDDREMKDEIDAINKEYKFNVKQILETKQKTNDNSFEIRGLQKTMEKHSLKLNASNGQKGGVWALHSDVDMYPILKSDDRNYHYTKFRDNLRPIKLEGPKLMDIRDFWRAINVAFMSTLQSNKGFRENELLDEYYLFEDDIVPPVGHTQRVEGMNAYKQFGAILMGHLKKEETIQVSKSQNANTTLKENLMLDNGFQLLWTIVQNSSPQLGGDARDLQKYVTTLKINDGEALLEFYIRALEMLQEIEIQKDTTG